MWYTIIIYGEQNTKIENFQKKEKERLFQKKNLFTRLNKKNVFKVGYFQNNGKLKKTFYFWFLKIMNSLNIYIFFVSYSLSFKLTSDLFANNIFTTSTWPFRLASMSAVHPLKKKKKKIYIFSKTKNQRKKKENRTHKYSYKKKIFDLKKAKNHKRKKATTTNIILILRLSHSC